MGHDHPNSARSHLRASAILHLHRFHLRLWHHGAACVPRSSSGGRPGSSVSVGDYHSAQRLYVRPDRAQRSEEHTSELQSRRDLVCRLLLEKKKKKKKKKKKEKKKKKKKKK